MAVAVTMLAGCASSGSPVARRVVVATVFPVAAALRELVAPGVPVRDLTPPGVEPHDLELTSNQLDAMLDARLVVVLGKGFQPSIEAGAARRDGPTLWLLDHVVVGTDPHFWLDPPLMRAAVVVLARAVARAGLGSSVAAVDARRDRIVAQLDALDAEYRRGLAGCARHTIVTAHAAFGHLASRYHLQQEAIAGISPEQEPDPRRLAQLADLVRRDGITTVFTERTVSPRVARTLAREAQVRTAVLDPIESPVHGRDFAGYLAVMRTNLRTLRLALGCG